MWIKNSLKLEVNVFQSIGSFDILAKAKLTVITHSIVLSNDLHVNLWFVFQLDMPVVAICSTKTL